MFDSLRAVNRLVDAGIPRKQAEVYVQILMDAFEMRPASKKDVKDLKDIVTRYFEKILAGMR